MVKIAFANILSLLDHPVELGPVFVLLQRQLVKDSRYGAKSIGLRVQLFADAVVLDLALADGHIYPR